MTNLPTDPIYVSNEKLECRSLCFLCQNQRPCPGSTSFTQEKLFYNFDAITEIIYPPMKTPRSADAFYLKNGKIHLIEIKNREVDGFIFERSIRNEIIEKLLDSIYTIKKNPHYFENKDVSSFNLLYSHLKRNGTSSMKLNLRGLGNTVGITISDNLIEIPIRAINLYSTHVKKHNRERLAESQALVVNFKLCFCDTIDESILE